MDVICDLLFREFLPFEQHVSMNLSIFALDSKSK